MNEENNDMNNKSELIMYITEDGQAKFDVTFDGDTVWLSLDQMAELFQRDKSTISKHIKKIFVEGELERNSVVANFATTAVDGKTYQVDYFNEGADVFWDYATSPSLRLYSSGLNAPSDNLIRFEAYH